MKKTILFLLVLSLSSPAIFAKSVNLNYAMQIAQNFYQQTTGKPVTVTLAYQCVNTDATNGLGLNEPIYYAFNVAGGKGFVLVAGDDLVKPILGYNTKGQFIIQNAPPVIADWFAKYGRQIIYAKVNQTPATQDITDQWNSYYNNVTNTAKQLRAAAATGPLLQTTWDQDLYYNDLCPLDGESTSLGYGGRCPTGCGATAMAQIMRYWSYPAQGTGSNSYTSNYGPLSANFGNTTYNWANMPYSVTSTNSDVANLMFDCGVAVNMDYGTLASGGSGSYIIGPAPSCLEAYTTYFGYNPATIQGLSRANYSEGDWTNLIQNELDSNRPLQYAGQGPAGGHTFVLDGSDGNGNFHINWGWSGNDNGYFSIDALDPGTESFDQDESMVIGIEPLNVTITAAGIELAEATTVNVDPIPFLSTFTVTTNVGNAGASTFNGSYCAALFDSSGDFIRFIGDILVTNSNPIQPLPSGDDYVDGLTFNDTATAVTVPGTYQIGIFYQASGASTWSLVAPETYVNPIAVTISGATSTDINLYSDIIASPGTFVQGQAATVSVNLTNLSTDTFYGEFEVVLLDLYGNFVEGINAIPASPPLPPNDHYENPLIFSTSSITAPEGQYILAVADEWAGTSNWYYCGDGVPQTYQNPVLIDVINTGLQAGITVLSPGDIKVYPNPASDKINIDAGDIEGNYSLKIFNTIGEQMTETNGILNKQKISADVSAYAAGMYLIQLKTAQGIINAKFIVR